MKDKIYYYNRNGILKLTLNEFPYYSEPSDFKNWKWGFNQQFGQFNSFRRDKSTYELIVGIAGNYPEQHDRLCDVFTDDILAGKPGSLEIRGWRLSCYIVEAQYEYGRRFDHKAVFAVHSINSTWTRSQTRSFNGTAGGGTVGDDLGRDYTYALGILGRGYDYGYSMAENHSAIIELSGADNGFELIVYGPQTNPVIYLNNRPVQINVDISATERLRVVSNGPEKTVKILSPSGVETDAFIYRDKTHTPFLTLGEYTEITYGEVRFDLTAIERRSEPSWT